MENNIKYEIVKFTDDYFELDVNVSPYEDTVWLTSEDMARLFETERSVITKHINNVYIDDELDKNSTCAKIAQVQIEGGRRINRQINYYNLDMIIAIGYRVKSKRGLIFRKWASKIIKEYLVNGYAISPSRVVVTNENYLNLVNAVERIDSTQIEINKRLITVEQRLSNTELPTEKIFFDGQFYDAYSLIQPIFEKANDEIIIIDNYLDRSILDRLAVKKNEVKVMIYTNAATSKLIELDINAFNKQYRFLTVGYTSKVHDRYIIIDKFILYQVGASLKDAGKKIFSITKLDPSFIGELLNKI